jgi:hypothetical protein
MQVWMRVDKCVRVCIWRGPGGSHIGWPPQSTSGQRYNRTNAMVCTGSRSHSYTQRGRTGLGGAAALATAASACKAPGALNQMKLSEIHYDANLSSDGLIGRAAQNCERTNPKLKGREAAHALGCGGRLADGLRGDRQRAGFNAPRRRLASREPAMGHKQHAQRWMHTSTRAHTRASGFTHKHARTPTITQTCVRACTHPLTRQRARAHTHSASSRMRGCGGPRHAHATHQPPRRIG